MARLGVIEQFTGTYFLTVKESVRKLNLSIFMMKLEAALERVFLLSFF